MGVDSLDVRVFWPSTLGSIDPGWEQDAAFDDRFLQGDDAAYAAPADDGGVHGHTADPETHTHTGNPHTHVFSAGNAAPSTVTVKFVTRGFLWVPDAAPPTGAHTHLSETSAGATITYQNKIVTINTTDALPPYRTMIVIKPKLVTADVPDDAVCFTDETPTGDGLPTGFAKYAALDGRFVRGANAGGANGGAATHDHASPGHDHDDDTHSHTQTISGDSDPAFRTVTGTPEHITIPTKHHRVFLVGKVLNDVNDRAITVDAFSSEPAYIELLGIQNTSGAATTPVGIIVAFVGDADDIPSNWQICDGNGDTLDCTDKQIKSTGVDGDVGDTGGNNTHTHTSPTHDHTHAGGHNHTSNVTMYQAAVRQYEATLRNAPSAGTHTHSWTIGMGTPTMQNTVVTMSTDDGRSAYRTVVWIKKLIERPGPKGLLASTF